MAAKVFRFPRDRRPAPARNEKPAPVEYGPMALGMDGKFWIGEVVGPVKDGKIPFAYHGKTYHIPRTRCRLFKLNNMFIAIQTMLGG